AGLGLDSIPDRHPAEGPLGGVCTALAAAQDRRLDALIVAACDQYQLHEAVVVALLGALADLDRDATAVVVGGTGPSWTPLPLAARVDPVQPVADAAFAAGDRSLQALLARTGIVVVGGLDPRSLVDADRPDDLPDRG
ncbi:MAG: NTP transferase domain-containing protein, partial [Acidimicrobiales bacterium]